MQAYDQFQFGADFCIENLLGPYSVLSKARLSRDGKLGICYQERDNMLSCELAAFPEAMPKSSDADQSCLS